MSNKVTLPFTLSLISTDTVRDKRADDSRHRRRRLHPLQVSAETFRGVDQTFTGIVTLTIFSPSGSSTFAGDEMSLMSAPATLGVATFSGVTLDIAGTYVLQASASGYLPGQTVPSIIVVPAAAADLYITQEPAAKRPRPGIPSTVVVGAKDQFRNVTALTGSVFNWVWVQCGWLDPGWDNPRERQRRGGDIQ